jgi:hypothetical protein
MTRYNDEKERMPGQAGDALHVRSREPCHVLLLISN